MAEGQKGVADGVKKGLATIHKVGKANTDYANDVAISCGALVEEIKQMQMQLRRYHF
jgi:hypothetical protein